MGLIMAISSIGNCLGSFTAHASELLASIRRQLDDLGRRTRVVLGGRELALSAGISQAGLSCKRPEKSFVLLCVMGEWGQSWSGPRQLADRDGRLRRVLNGASGPVKGKCVLCALCGLIIKRLLDFVVAASFYWCSLCRFFSSSLWPSSSIRRDRFFFARSVLATVAEGFAFSSFAP